MSESIDGGEKIDYLNVDAPTKIRNKRQNNFAMNCRVSNTSRKKKNKYKHTKM